MKKLIKLTLAGIFASTLIFSSVNAEEGKDVESALEGYEENDNKPIPLSGPTRPPGV